MKEFVESRRFHNFIMAVIAINSITLGLHTSPMILAKTGDLLEIIDDICLLIFIIELALKLFVYRLSFFKPGWNVFDFIIVAMSVMSSFGALSAFRTFRIFRVMRSLRGLRALRLISGVRHLRVIMDALVTSIPGMLWSGILLLLIYYICSIMAVSFFGEDFPELFGNIARSMYTLFQMMTFESWSMVIVRPIMEIYPLAWLFFIPFMLITAFVVMNVVVGILVNSISEVAERMSREEVRSKLADEKREIGSIREEIRLVREHLEHLEDLLEDENKQEY